MKVGITGARGLLGSALSELLGAEGHEVVAYSRNPQAQLAGAGEVRSFSPYDAAETDVSGLDAMVHLAGEPVLGYWSARKKEKIWSSRVEGTEGLVKAMKECDDPPQVLVSASGTGYYGDRGDEILTEESSSGSGFLAEVTRGWESAATQAEDLGIRVVRGRIGMVLGRDGGAAPLLRKLFRLGLGGPLGSGNQWMSWVHVDDVVRMILYALDEKNISGVVNFCASEPVRNRDFTRMLATELRRPAIAWAPSPVLKLVLGGMTEMLLFSQRVEPEVLDEHDFEWRYGDLASTFANVMASD